MSELRKDPVIDRWVIVSDAPVRIPTITNEKKPVIALEGVCPFCPGSEHMCPPEIYANRQPYSHANDSRWNLRVIPSRAPVLMVEEELKRSGEGMYDRITGIGANEVIIETPRHNIRQSSMSHEELNNVFWAYRDRSVDLKKDSRMKFILIFKNCGTEAGATIEHPYSLLMGLPIVPRGIIEEFEGARKHFEYKERCIYCDIINQEKQQELRVVSENRDFLAIEPFAPRSPFETWILPKRHSARFESIEPAEIHELAIIFKEVMKRMDLALNYPAYNYMIHTSPVVSGNEYFYHWHIEILPRMSVITGLEWASDLYVNPTSPEEAAAFLREMSV